MSKDAANVKRKASAKDARPAKKVKSTDKAQNEAVNPKLKAAADAKKSRKRAADFVEDAAPAVKAPVEDSPKPAKKVKISKKVEVVEAAPTSISKKKSTDKKEKKAVVVAAEEEEEIALPAVGDDEDEEDVAALLAGFSSEESDAEDEATEGIAIDQLPQPALDKKAKKALAKAQKKADQETPGTIYIGRIPHGFYEPQMRAYFSQFGDLVNLRLARNKKTGASKHYAFLQFSSTEVADIVARTMNNYLMFGHILKVRVMPPEQIHPELWKGANKRYKVVPRGMLERKSLDAAKGRGYWKEKVGKEQKKREEKRKQMAELGYDLDVPTLRTVDDVPMQEVDETTVIEGAEPASVGKTGEDLVKAIADASAVVDEASVDIENVIAEGKKAKQEKKDKAKKDKKTKETVKVSKKAKA